MNRRKLLLSTVLVFAAVTAWATFNYEYGPDEYVTIYQGISPDGHLAITAHGKGEYGYDNFHLYLFDAVAGKKIGPLEEISEVLDTGAGAYAVRWKGDSSEATIVYRVDWHAPLKAISYRFAKNRAFPLTHQPVDLRDDDPLVQLYMKSAEASQTPGRAFGAPKARP